MSFIRRSRIKKSIVKWLRYCFTFEFWDKYGFLQISFLHTVLQYNSSVLFTAWRKSGISWKEKPLIEFSASFFDGIELQSLKPSRSNIRSERELQKGQTECVLSSQERTISYCKALEWIAFFLICFLVHFLVCWFPCLFGL